MSDYHGDPRDYRDAQSNPIVGAVAHTRNRAKVVAIRVTYHLNSTDVAWLRVVRPNRREESITLYEWAHLSDFIQGPGVP